MSTQKPFADPEAQRETERYEFPVPSREAILQFLTAEGEPLPLKRLAEAMGVAGERDLESFSRRLRAMERDGQILRNRRGRYGLIQKMDLEPGRVVGHADGFGFLVRDGGGADWFIANREMRRVFPGDRVVVQATGTDSRGRQECRVVEILERGVTQVVGRFARDHELQFVVSEDARILHEIFIPLGDEHQAKPGQVVVAEITEYPEFHRKAVGRVIEVLGEAMSPGMEIEIALRSHDLPHVFPEQVVREAEAFGSVDGHDTTRGLSREDWRGTALVTIDGEDARDFDDAVYCELKGRGYRLRVAIADVSHYVVPGSALDDEAYRRGTSVYFPAQVIPMLPERLSNDLCSLNPGVDRYALGCEMDISGHGRIESYRFVPVVIRSRARLTYTSVAGAVVERRVEARNALGSVLPDVENLYALYQVLHKARLKRGAIDFELPESRIIFNEQRKIDRVEPVVRNDAHRLIEECMLAANVCAAEFLAARREPLLYRVHGGPTPEKLAALREFLFEFGLSLEGGDKPEAKHYARVLEKLDGGPQTRLIQAVLLRSLSQAFYSPEPEGHFALAYPHYAHFTSPIRRYPDLLVHRAIKCALGGQPRDVDGVDFKAAGDHCSMTERRADDATRDVMRWLKAEYMSGRVGEEFDGVISGVTGFGVFVELSEVFVDGLVHVTSLGNDYYHFDPARHLLMGERTRTVYRLGDAVRVRVLRVDLDERKIDFELVGTTGRGRARGGAGASETKGRKGTEEPAGKGKKKRARSKSRSGHRSRQ